MRRVAALVRQALANFGRRMTERFSEDPGHGETLVDAIKRTWL